MQNDAEDSHLHVIETSQATDTFLYTSINDSVVVRLLSVRCLESQLEALPSQDYARVTSNSKGSSLCFCVCDGVGSSYKGDFAAKYLSTCLLSWLGVLPGIHNDPSTLSTNLHARLEQWTRQGQIELEHQDIPSETPALVREILEEQRAISGSQTVFLCGRVDYEERSPLLPASGHMPALFCWMGNVTAQLFTAEGTYITLGDRDNDRNRWSTVHGCLGALSLLILEPKVIDRLIIYTDGLDAIEQELAHLSEHELQARTQQLLQSPTNDDMTVLDLQWLHTPVEKECVP